MWEKKWPSDFDLIHTREKWPSDVNLIHVIEKWPSDFNLIHVIEKWPSDFNLIHVIEKLPSDFNPIHVLVSLYLDGLSPTNLLIPHWTWNWNTQQWLSSYSYLTSGLIMDKTIKKNSKELKNSEAYNA